jgi:hypothetical protein
MHCEHCNTEPCQCETNRVRKKVQTVTEVCKEALASDGVTEATVEHEGIKVTLTKKAKKEPESESEPPRVIGFQDEKT